MSVQVVGARPVAQHDAGPAGETTAMLRSPMKLWITSAWMRMAAIVPPPVSSRWLSTPAAALSGISSMAWVSALVTPVAGGGGGAAGPPTRNRITWPGALMSLMTRPEPERSQRREEGLVESDTTTPA
jgi:hypothetical protein